MDKLLSAVKQACKAGLWSRGVTLSRQHAVSVEQEEPDELILRVRNPARAVAATVVLYPSDLEWTCDCGSSADPCEHVAAAVIALRQAETSGSGLGGPEQGEQLEYELVIERHQLQVQRTLRSTDGGSRPLNGSLASLVARRISTVTASTDDLTVDRILTATPRGNFNVRQVRELLKCLGSARTVRFDGRTVQTSGEPVKPLGVVFDRGDQIVFRIEVDPRVTQVLAPGIVLLGDQVRPLAETDLSGTRLERLPLERSLAATDTGELVQRVIPELSRRIAIEVTSKRLPTLKRAVLPRIHFDLGHQGHGLSVLPTLVYGDPPLARVDGDELVVLGEVVPERSRIHERQLVHRLLAELDLAPGRRVDFDGNDAARFVDRLRRFSGEEGNLLPALRRSKQPIDVRVTFASDDFEVRFVAGGTEDEESEADPRAVLQAWRQGLELVPVSGGGFAPLPRDWLERFGEQLSDLLEARRGRDKLPLFALPSLARLAEHLDQPAPPSFGRLAPLLRDFEAIPSAALPSDLVATLRPYQRTAVDWLCFLRDLQLGAVLADDMGLGKTLQTLCALNGRTLVVCPKSVMFNWQREIARFRPELTTAVYHGPARELTGAQVTITTYAVLRLDADALAKEKWDAVVLDEAQAIKNPESQTARAAFELDASFRVALSGTPVENRLEELWSIFHFTHRGLLGGRSAFDARYARPIADGDSTASERLKRLTKPFLLRRMKRVVATDLPPRTDMVLEIELEPEERRVYDAVQAATRSEVVTRLREGGSVIQALEALLRMRQAACHAALVPGQSAQSSSKVDALLEALSDAALDGHKALVFSQWTSLLDLIEPHLHEAGIEFLRLDGKTRDRGSVVQAFQDDSGPPVLLASLKAGGTGLNLTAADHVFILDPWYNPAAEEQAADRAHRIGQTRPVIVYRLVAKNTVEEGILRLQQQKRQLAEGALEAANQAVSVTRDDLLSLLD